MSGVAKAGPSRIPTFGSRLPQPTHKPPSIELTKHHVGKRVRFTDKEGFLRFIGNVHFSTGIWCGIELSHPTGKNNGTVQGVQYFTSAENCGLMAPLSKVELVDDNCEALNEDSTSGPYSMLFIDTDLERIDSGAINTFFSDNNNLNRKVSDTLHFTFTKNPRQKETLNVLQKLTCSNDNLLPSKKSSSLNSTCIESEKADHNSLNLEKEENVKANVVYSERKPLDSSKKRLADPNKTFTRSTENLIQDETCTQSSEELNVDAKRRKTFTKLFPTSGRSDATEHFLKKLRLTSVYGTPDKPSSEDDSKRNSLEFDESLGILTPGQMDGVTFFNTRSPSLDLGIGELLNKTERKSEVPSPRDESLGLLNELVEDMSKHKDDKSTADSFAEPSLGIIDEQLLGNLTLYTDTSNMRIPLDKNADLLTRIEQTPSPEELPFDPTPIVEITDPKLDTAKTKTTNSFITSITSITSLDTGYQGDGEMSRPASRGAENSPLTRRPIPRPQVRNKPDPMTDSDFYTESDADIQDEHPLRGDRKAQVIDGTLYGVDPQAAADIYANNRENMDSSGIFTDLDTAKTEEESSTVEIPAPSPSEASTKTISENSQSNLREILERKSEKKEQKKPAPKENPKKRNAPSPGITSPSSFSSPRHGIKEDHSAKKYKIPKRDIPAKVKANLETTPQQSREKISVKKPVNKWDAVMNKISKNEQNKTNFKNVKSKVFNDIPVNKIPSTRILTKQNEVKKTNTRSVPVQKTPTNKTSAIPKLRLPASSTQIMQPNPRAGTPIKRPASAQSTVYNAEKRRIRRTTRQNEYEDISTTSSTSGSSRRPTADPQLVLTANKLPPKIQQSPTPAAQQTKATNTEKVSILTKDATTLTEESPLIIDALGVVIQHLSFGVVPRLQTTIEFSKVEIKKLREHCLQLEKLLNQERQVRVTEKERYKQLEHEYEECKNEMKTATGQLERILKEETEKHKEAIQNERRHRRSEVRRLLESFNNYLHKGDNSEMCFFEELRQSEANLLEGAKDLDHILLDSDRQELYYCKSLNENLRDRLVETESSVQRKNKELETIKKENQKLKQQLQRKESSIKEQSEKFRRKSIESEHHMQGKLKILEEENSRLRGENEKLIGFPEYASDQEERSFQTLAEIKQNEIELLRKEIYEANSKLEEMEIYLDKSQILSARVEDLEVQLKRKTEVEHSLIQDKKKLEEILREENNQKRRALQFNEELQWKLKQNKEVINKILGHEDMNFNRSILSESFNEKYHISRNSLERSFSFREKTTNNVMDDLQKSRKSRTPSDIDWDEIMGPTSPKVKSVVEKSESLSYVLDLDDSPDVVASRIIRRSFRQNTPPKGQFLKSPSNKRSSPRNPLSQSASSSAILSPSSDKCSMSTPISSHHNHEQIFSWEEDPRYSEHIEDQKPSREEFSKEDFSLPPLPSECRGAQHLPAPKLLAHENNHHREGNSLCLEQENEEKGKQSSEDEEDESTDM